jgi:hypothetical protein
MDYCLVFMMFVTVADYISIFQETHVVIIYMTVLMSVSG